MKKKFFNSKLPADKIAKIREEVKKGKTKKKVAEELSYSYKTVKKYTKDIVSSSKVPVDEIAKIREEVKKGKTKKKVAEEFGYSYITVRKYTKDIIVSSKIPDDKIVKIREEVKKGKTKIKVANDYRIAYSTVKKYTKDIKTNNRISKDLEQTIIEEWVHGKPKCHISIDNNVSKDTVIKYTRGKSQKISKKIIKYDKDIEKKVREKLNQEKTIKEISEDFNITYEKARKWVKKIRPFKQRGLTTELREQIRKSVLDGKTKRQVSIDLQLPYSIVIYHTRDIISTSRRRPDITCNELALLEELTKKGYAFPASNYAMAEYRGLKRRFPSEIFVLRMYGKSIFYHIDQADKAMTVFLELFNNKIISYAKLKQISDAFKLKIPKKEKKKYIIKKK